MINLPKDRVLVYRDGSGMVLDLETIRSELERCCSLAGLPDPELADDVVDVVQRFWARQHKAQSMPTLTELERLVVQILVDSGMRDIARMFQDKRRVPPADPGATMIQVANLQLPELLARDAFFLDKPVDTLAKQVRQALEKMNLGQVTENFVQQLARHLWFNDQHAKPPVRPGPKAYWLIPRDQMETLAAEFAGDLLRASGIQVRPVGSLFPRLAIELSLLEFARRLGPPPLTELLVIPAFDDLVAELTELADRLRSQVEHQLGERMRERLPIRLQFTGAARLLEEWLGLDVRQATALRRDWDGFLHRSFGEGWQVHVDFG